MSTPFVITAYRPDTPRFTPRSRSAALTQRMTSAQRAPSLSHSSAARPAYPAAASNDQECGWKTVGIRRRTVSRPQSPAFEEWR